MTTVAQRVIRAGARRVAGAGLATAMVATLLLAPPVAATAGPGAPPGSGLALEPVPFAMDASNQAGWWRPLAEHNGRTYVAFNAPSPVSDFRHEVHLAVRAADGQWSAACLRDADGACVHYVDDIGHNQPSIAIDGDGHIHAFVSMHNDQWRYFRSDHPESVESMVDRSGELPDQQTAVTYPVPATAPNGDLYLLARVNPGDGYTARLYRWQHADRSWHRVAVLARESGFTPYPDDVAVDVSGRVHLAWEWARGGPSGSRYYGSYLVYEPRSDRFVSAGGDEVAVPVTTTHPTVVYEPDEGVVQSARFALVQTAVPRLAGVAYRYRPPGADHFEVRWAAWQDGAWQREVVDAGEAGSPAAIGATHHGAVARVYFVQNPRCDELDMIEGGGLFVAEKQVRPGGGSPGDWQRRWLGGGADVERLAVEARRGGTDVLYLAAPRDQHPAAAPELRLGTLDRSRRPAPADPSAFPAPAGNGAGQERTNWAHGAPVEVSSTLRPDTIGECAVDGNTWADDRRWISAAGDPEPTITIDLGQPVPVAEVRLFSGYQGGTTDLVRHFTVEAHVAGGWVPLADVRDNQLNPAIVLVPEPAQADRVRLRMPAGTVRVYQVEVYSTIEAAPVAASLAASPPVLPYPGDATELTATLVNRTPEPLSGIAEVTVPAGWTVEPAAAPYQLDPHGQTTVTYAVTSPPDAETPAVYEITVRTAPDDPGTALLLPIRSGIVYSGDGAPFYTETGSWSGSTLRAHDDSLTRFTQGGSGATATWAPELRQAGTYQVHMWHPTNPGTTTAAEITVTHAGGTTGLVLNQRDTGDGWHALGTWEMAPGTGSVTITAVADGYHRAGAVWFELLG